MKNNILNLTQHEASVEQKEAGVYEPVNKEKVQTLLTFNELPSKELIKERATALAEVACKEGANIVMIGGAPFFMSVLEDALKEKAITVVYAFSRRESVDIKQEDGSTRKIAVFKHLGFVEV